MVVSPGGGVTGWSTPQRTVERLLGECHPLDGDRGLVGAERGKAELGVDRPGDRERRPMELRWEVQRVDGVGVGVDVEVGVDDVVDDEPDGVGDGPRVDVCRGHAESALDECGGDVGASTDSDLDDAVVAGEVVDERVDFRGHGGTFMAGALIAVVMLVDIVPVGNVPATVKRAASSALRSVYDCDVTITDGQSVPNGAYDAGRNQYSAENFIQLAERVGRGEKNVAITPLDLFYRRRNYVFGLAYLDGSGSVVSTYRLQTSSDGGFSNKSAADIFEDRVRKEIVHEIGHTYGLEHCDNNRCVMNFSPTVREVDIKEENLCGSCQRLIN